MGTGTNGRIQSLASLARALSRSAPLLRQLEVASEETLAAIGAASVSVSRIEEQGRIIRVLVNVGHLGPTEERWPEDETYVIDEFHNLPRYAEDNLPWIVCATDPDADPREVQLLEELEKGCAVGAPLVVDGQSWGEIYATRESSQERYCEDDMAYLQALAAILAGAISRAQREEALQELAYRDPLTELPNRRALDEHAEACFRAGQGRVTVLVVDVNGLKLVNDTAGHQAGDQLLQAVAADMTRQFEQLPGSLVARVGGDEFTVLVPAHPVADVLAVAEALCAATWNVGAPADVSCGVASVELGVDAAFTTPSQLLAAADRAQYVAKHGRLRRPVLADDPADERETMGA